LLRKIQIFKALDIEIKKQKGPSTIKRPYKDHKSLKEELGQARISIIAEISAGNPMYGKVRQAFKPSTHAKSLLENGAKALSVATDPFLYASNDKHLSEVRSAVACPLIRRDFIFEEYQVEESKILGADAIFLSAALLEPERIKTLQTLAKAKNLDVVVEVASETDLEAALDAEAQIICVVGRNLDTWELSWEKAIKLIKKVPPKKCLRLVEAGISTLKQVKELEAMGVHGLIIGDALLNEFYPGKRLGQILAGVEPAKKSPKKPPSHAPQPSKSGKAQPAVVESAKKSQGKPTKPSAPAPPPAKAKSGKAQPAAFQPAKKSQGKPAKPSSPPLKPSKAKSSKSTEVKPSTSSSSKRPTKGNKETSMVQAKTPASAADLAAKKTAPKKAAPAKKAAAKPTAKKAVKPAAKKVAAKATKPLVKKATKPAAKKAAPAKKAAAPVKKAAPKKAAAPVKKAAPKKAAAKAPVKKAAPKKAAAKAPVKKVTKPVAKKTAAKAPAKKATKPVAKKAAPKKPAKAVVKKALAAKKPAPKASPAKKPAAKKGCKK
jgi:indole-3-glycerol phosphate synthase